MKNRFTARSFTRPHGYALGVFVMVMMVVTSLVVVSFLASTNNITESRRGQDSASSRAVAQDAASRLYSQFITDDDFRNGVIGFNYNASEWRTLDAVPYLNASGAPSGEICDPSDPPSDIPGRACVRLAVALKFYGTNQAFSDTLAALAAGGNTAAVPQALAVRVDVASGCKTTANGDPESCELRGSYTQRILPSQFYQYAFYNQFSTLGPSSYPTQDLRNAAAADCADRYGIRVNPARGDNLVRGPNACVEIAYQSNFSNPNTGDVIDGPLFSNDDYLLTCNSPVFKDEVYVNPMQQVNPAATNDLLVYRSAGAAPYNFAGCRASGAAPKFTPAQTDTSVDGVRYLTAFDTVMPKPDDYRQLVSTLTTSGYATRLNDEVIDGVVNVRFETTSTGTMRYFVDGVNKGTVAADTLFYVDGNATVEGSVLGSVSLYASGTLTIIGDLVRFSQSSPGVYTKCAIPASGSPDPCTSVIGLSAGKSIVIREFPSSNVAESFSCPVGDTACGSPSGNVVREVHAILISLGDSVYVSDNATTLEPTWNKARWNPADAPELKFYGAIATKYQGVYGGYDQNTGDLISGFRKNFQFDRRLSQGIVNVPFLPSPISENWDRLDFSEITR